MQSVLEYQMKTQEKKLKPIVNVFKMKDKDSDGIVNEEQFISIV